MPDWAGAQHRFADGYNADPSGPARTPVHWRVIDGGRFWTGRLGWLLTPAWALHRILRRRMMNEEPLFAVWLVSGSADAPLVFEFRGQPSGPEGDGVAVGDLKPNGALCVELADGAVVWPTYNPRHTQRAAPRRLGQNGAVGLRRWLLDLLSRGEPSQADPNEMVELEIVRKPSGPLLVAGLEREGITVFALEWFDVATRSCTELRLMVPRHQHAEATEVMDRLR